ncbi:unnamed protein product [Clavelina lepadiformis]|uniref:Sulfotransferase n=1 Tax=Clavelina lepadiformis TaxID=159417 RepID=A0ABP0GHU8_CLALP
MMKGSNKLPKYSMLKHASVEGSLPLLSAITQESLDSASSFEPEPGDVFVITYPKCGTTWMNNILYLMKNNGVTVEEGDNIANYFPFIELIGGEATKEKPRPRFIKSHLLFDILPQSSNAKYIHVARNPKDCVVSFYHHTVGYEQFYDWNDGKLDDYFEIFMAGGCDWGSYFEMVPRWYERSLKQDNILFLFYEDMIVDLRKEVLKVADFLGPSWKESLLRNNEEILDKVLENASFSAMKAKQKRYFYSPRPKDRPFLRKGAIGSWRDELSEEQSKLIDLKMAETAQKYPDFENVRVRYADV